MFHTNPDNGMVSRCRSTQGRCPFGGTDQHYDSIADARLAFEHTQSAVPEPQRRETNVGKTVEDLEGELTHARESLPVLERDVKAAKSFYNKKREAGKFERDSALFIRDKAERLLRKKHERIKALENDLARLDQSATPSFGVDDINDIVKSLPNQADTVIIGGGDGEGNRVVTASWARARELASALTRAGALVEYVHGGNRGQRLRVHDPASTKFITHDASDFAWNPTSNSFSVESSDLQRRFADEFLFTSQNGLETQRMILQETERDVENDVQAWHYRPANPQLGWTLTVYND